MKYIQYIRHLTLLYCILGQLLISTAQISLVNSSFEGQPQDAKMPDGWLKCDRATTPDILPGPWGVYLTAQDGNSYLGMICREDGSYESIVQRAPKRLLEGQCYESSIHLARYTNYAGYSKPIHLRISISNKKCSMGQVIFTSPLIDQRQWMNFDFEFTPEYDAKYIRISAFDPTGELNGHVLIDNLGPITICSRA